jgi:hypothetical protein
MYYKSASVAAWHSPEDIKIAGPTGIVKDANYICHGNIAGTVKHNNYHE